jgi:uncharacterized damage-inducible protein DinB
MNNKFLLFTLLISSTLFAQQTNVKDAFLEKWGNSKNYLIEMAQLMPEEDYGYKPTERQRSFKEQLEHIQSNMDWLCSKYFNMEKAETSKLTNEKEHVITSLEAAFDGVTRAVEATSEEELKETVQFFAGPKSKLQILNLLLDHVTHHRGQLIVYLNLKEIEPPKYVGW